MASQTAQRRSNVLAKIEKHLSEEKYYDAQQMYKTVYHRFAGAGKIEEARDILVEGAVTMLKRNQLECGSELGGMLAELYISKSIPVTPESLEAIHKISSSFPEENSEAGVPFMKSALKWSKKCGPYDKQGEPKLNALLAMMLWNAGEVADSQRYFIHSNCPEDFASMLVEWAQAGYPGESDLFITRAVLSLLAEGNIRDAGKVFLSFKEKMSGSLQESPLLNFVEFLLLTVERDAEDLFKLLKMKYEKSLSRDPSFRELLQKVGAMFFNQKAHNSRASAGGAGNPLGNIGSLMEGLLGGGAGGNSSGANPLADMMKSMLGPR